MSTATAAVPVPTNRVEVQLDHVRQQLVREFAGQLSPEDVAAEFAHAVAYFDHAKVRTYLPILCRRSAHDALLTRQLQAVARRTARHDDSST